MMHKIAVYGTLKDGHWNNGLLRDSELIEKTTLPNLSLFYSGGIGSFPVATPEEGTSVVAEIYKVDEQTLSRLDSLEGYRPSNPEGSMYIRTELEDGVSVYIGNPYVWEFETLREVEKKGDLYEWS